MDGGYDPANSSLYDDSEITYKPSYVHSEAYEDSSVELSSDDELNDGDRPNNGKSLHDATKTISSTFTPKYDPCSVEDQRPSDNFEYSVEPLANIETPAYAPSHTLGSRSPSECSDALSLDGGYPSPVSSMHPSVMTPGDLDQRYKSLSGYSSPASDFANDETTHRFNEANSPALNSSQPISNTDSHPIGQTDIKIAQTFDEFDDEDEDIENKVNEDFEGFERDEQPVSQVDGIIADIFGESDAEEEFEGFAENEIEKELPIGESVEPAATNDDARDTTKSDKDSDSGSESEDVFVSDFDKIMAKKKEELRRRRRRNRDIEFLNDSDDQIIATISRMREAADEDRHLLASNKPAIKKLKMVAEVTSLLKRADLKTALIDNGMLSAITDWLAPLPGHTLPNLVIRDTMLSCLTEFQSLSTEVLQDSGIGKAIMYLYKHPLETKENKDRAGRLINEWLRPIFNLTSDYRTLTKEERKQLDYEHLPKRRNIDHENYDRRDINRELDGDPKGTLRPGDPGWIGRARVPQPSNKDYIIRPKCRVSEGNRFTRANEDADDNDDDEDRQRTFRNKRRQSGTPGALGATSRIEAHIRNLRQISKRKMSKATRAVAMSLEGRKMSL